MALMTTEKGTQTPEQLAKTIVQDIEPPVMIELPGTVREDIRKVVQYLNREVIAVRSESWFKKEYNSLVTEMITKLVKDRSKAITDYLAKKEENDKNDSFRKLIVRGISVPDAYKDIYGTPVVEANK
jgi:hypothetical protein